MTTAVVYARLRVTDPGRWRAVALAWRRWAALAGRLVAGFAAGTTGAGRAWAGSAATAATARLAAIQRRLVLFRVLCWQADQAASEFAAALTLARRLLARALTACRRRGLTVDDDGAVRGGAAPAELGAAISMAGRADAAAAERLERIEAAVGVPDAPAVAGRPACTASPEAVRRWWAGLDPAARWWLLATEPAWLAPLDGIPAADRDAANRLLLDERRAGLDRALATAGPGERDRLRMLRRGLDALADRLAADAGPRAYLLRLDLAGEGRAVVALGDPDRAGSVLTHVPGMTSSLASAGGELDRAGRVAGRAAELSPTASASAVLWLDYDAPDFVDEAASARRAEAGAPALRRFQEGLRATHDGSTARLTVVGHSYGSLVVGKAAAGSGLAADAVVFVGSPGVGADSAAELAVPAGQVWSSTSRDDVIQYAAVAPGGLVRDLAVSAVAPAVAPLALGTPERDLWFGRNPSDPSFGARVFPSGPTAGHVGYWDEGSPSLDALAAITLGTAR
jgi:hypothetical protein